MSGNKFCKSFAHLLLFIQDTTSVHRTRGILEFVLFALRGNQGVWRRVEEKKKKVRRDDPHRFFRGSKRRLSIDKRRERYFWRVSRKKMCREMGGREREEKREKV